MIEMMKAAIFVEPGKMTVEEVPKATLRQDDDIVIRVVRTCVCGSDLWFFRGLSRQAAHSQVGHESIGVVEEVGAAVESVKPGDFVVVPFPYSCGKCPVCKAGAALTKVTNKATLSFSGAKTVATAGYLGGLVGLANVGSVYTDCHNTGEFIVTGTARTEFIGGIVAGTADKTEGSLVNCTNKGNFSFDFP